MIYMQQMLILYLVEKQRVAAISYDSMVRGCREMGREGMARPAGDGGRGLCSQWEMGREGMDSGFGSLVVHGRGEVRCHAR
jgi:hypothetical protein